jgi:hypothetical protein
MSNHTYAADAVTFQKITGVPLHLDGLLSALLNKPCIDVIKIDKALIAKYDYEAINPYWSMKDFLTIKFGKDVAEIAEKYL